MYHKDLTIFSVFHKTYLVPHCDFIRPIQVAQDFSGIDLGFLSDNRGDHIADKNQRLCETTALYWIWKNLSSIPSNYIGLSHYRRYFTIPKVEVKKKFWSEKVIENPAEIYELPINEENLGTIANDAIKNHILERLRQSDIVLPKSSVTGLIEGQPINLKDQYIYHHLMEDWLVFENTLEEMHPEYAEFAAEFFTNTKKMHCYGMFIADRKFLDDYCNWLFPILFELERTIKVSLHPYQNRAIGFLSERLLNLYVYKNKLAIAEMPVAFFI